MILVQCMRERKECEQDGQELQGRETGNRKDGGSTSPKVSKNSGGCAMRVSQLYLSRLPLPDELVDRVHEIGAPQWLWNRMNAYISERRMKEDTRRTRDVVVHTGL